MKTRSSMPTSAKTMTPAKKKVVMSKQKVVVAKKNVVKAKAMKQNMQKNHDASPSPKGIHPYSNEPPSLNNVDTDIWMNHILPFVGKNQYRFVGAVSRHFRISYFTLFSPVTSFGNISTIEQASLCCEDVCRVQRGTLFHVMIQKGHQDIVKYLYISHPPCHSKDPQWTAATAERGDFELLRWLVRKIVKWTNPPFLVRLCAVILPCSNGCFHFTLVMEPLCE
jgi:hypothetical protein